MTLWPSDQCFLEKLAAVDFGPIAFQLMCSDSDQTLTLTQATQAIEQYRRFLFLHHRHPNHPLVPSQEIDRVWHVHILDTAKYREDCQFLFGRFIDHFPYFGVGNTAQQQTLKAAYLETQALYEQCFT
jgi:hypothetical protein